MPHRKSRLLFAGVPACRGGAFSALSTASGRRALAFRCVLLRSPAAHLSFDDLQESCAVNWRRKQHAMGVGPNGPVLGRAGRWQLRPHLLPDAEGLLQGFLLPAGPGAAAQPPRGPGSPGRSSQRAPPPPHRQGQLRGHHQRPAEDSGLWLQIPGSSPRPLIPRRPLSEVAPSGGLLKASGWAADSRVQAQ
ncbi:uncharacterized protein LOC101684076 isoform X1 [Mustela putorius furo]|uniref:Uncharacterized protein LOC101684076 isoform X1 n=1 Tax=Mustela putorius furo TaxID=9669 RepID=A0A8U0NVS2_MUSPF|nr:uncharacterized protein LOC101684076 isoform X1 [Mustela putorius furo]